MRDEIVRIILEAKDKMSGVVRDAERNVNQSFSKIRNDLSQTDRDFERSATNIDRSLKKSDSSMKNWSNSIRGHLRGLQSDLSRTRNDFEKTNIAFRKVERGAGGRFESVAQNKQNQQVPNPAFVAASTAFSAFRQGKAEAKQIEEQLRARFADNEKQLKEQKEALREEVITRRESLRIFSDTEREELRKRQEAEAKELDREIRERKQALADEQDVRDDRVRKRTRKRKLAFDQEEYERKKQLNKELADKKKSTDYEIYKLEEERRKRIREVQDSPTLPPRVKEDEIAAIKQAYKEEIRTRRDARNEDATARKEANIQINRDNATARDSSLAKLEDANANVRRENAKAVAKEIAEKKAAAVEISTQERNDLSKILRDARTSIDQQLRTKAFNLSGKGEADLVKEFRDARAAEQALNQDTSVLSRTFRKLGNDTGDFFRGLRRGRSDLREVDKLARAADTGFARLGQTIGKFTKNIGNLVNLRWYLVISAIQILGQLVLVLAANLISLASSAALAAAALGAGLVAAVSQAIPVVGLLYAAFSRVTAAFTAAQQASKANATSSQDSRAQAEAQTAAQQRLSDALYGQVQAVKSLAEARKQARRDIVDAINAEIDANYALKDAEFAVLDAKEQLRQLEQQNKQDQQSLKDAEAAVKEAKERLAAAKKEGDAQEIENAQQQLALAQQNVEAIKGQATSADRQRQIKEQKLAVKEAEQRQKEAKIAQHRQREDTAKTVKLGVKGNQQVVDALHSVAQANREVANAEQGVTDASKKQASAGNLLQRQLSQLDPAERKLYKAFVAIRDQFKKTFRPITDIIVNAVTGAVDKFTAVLRQPKIAKAFTGLAHVIANGITELSKFFTSKGFINDFIGFIHAAENNIPTVIKILENLAKAFLGVAKAGQPIVKDLLGRFEGLTGRFQKAVNAPTGGSRQDQPGGARFAPRQTQGQSFVSKAKDYLDAWIKLADAVGRVFRYLITDSAPAGKGLLGALTHALNNLADFLKDNPEKVNKFFTGMAKSLEELSKVLFPLVTVLLSAFTGSNATAFTKFTAQVVLPGVAALIKFLGLLASIALKLSHIPGLKLFLQFLVFEKALNRIFPVSQKATDALKKLFLLPFSKKARDEVGLFIFKLRLMGAEAWFQFKRIGRGAKAGADAIASFSKRAILAFGKAIKAAAQFVWEMAVAAVKAAAQFAKAMLESAYQALKTFVAFIIETVIPTLVSMGEAMYAALGPWGLLAIAIGLIIVAIIKWHDKILAALEYVFNWIKDHWKLLAAILFGPFGLVVVAIIKWHKQIIGFFEKIIDWVKSHWKTILVAALLAPFGLGGLIILAIYKFKDKILSIFKDIWKGIKNIFGSVAHWLTSNLEPHLHIHHWHGIPYPSITFGKEKDLVKDEGGDKEQAPTYVPPHNGKKGKIINKDGRPVMDTGGRVPGHDGQAVPIIAHAGEWVLNKAQQMKLAHKLNDTRQQVSSFLFGSGKKGGDTGHHGKNRQLAAHEKGKGTKTHKGNHAFPYDLVSQQDDSGNTVWFIEALTGQFLELSSSDAAHMIRTGGKWIPKWIKNHGFKLRKAGEAIEGMQHYMAGGIVKPEMSYAMGGVVNSPQNTYGGSSVSTQGGNVKHQHNEMNFNVKTEGETDWNYVMRLAAMHAQSSF